MAASGGGSSVRSSVVGVDAPGGNPEMPSPFRSGGASLPDESTLPAPRGPSFENLSAFLKDMPDRLDLGASEEEVKAFWEDIKAFEKQLVYSKDKPEYTFYDGPPFATGLPHYGHILAGTIKDTVTRYAAQTGHFVSRRFGWDCHGLPVEFEIDKMHGISGRQQVLDMGIDKYNALCRGIVTRYTKEWEMVVSRLGRWIDFENDYKTMEPWYMESVWWVFKQLWKKELVYEGFKVMPFSTGCATPLSNFEAGLNYQDAKDPAVVVSFPLLDEPEVMLVAWTTTPWTLPSNLALCVHPELDYVKIKDAKSGHTYILAKSRLVQLYPKMAKKGYKGGEFEELATMKGRDLVGKRYKPLFDYFEAKFGDRAFRVLMDEYVTDDAGTGVVHQAPAFGEDDFRVCTTHGVVDKDGEIPCPVDYDGKFVDPVVDFKGRHVKAADEAICAELKARGRLVQKNSIVHSYPFCWRSETPLIYRTVPSWFVRVESIRDRLVANNEETEWVPPAVKDGRFRNWLLDARDWAISRNRFWGTPLPIWRSDDGKEIVVVESVEELRKLSGVSVTDLHRESIDSIEIPSQEGRGTLKRVDEVFDCWFESGSMPYAQVHYPFEDPTAEDGTKTTGNQFLDHRFPAHFIAEGLDQTRGWFYTLTVLSTALFDKPSFRNLIVNGLVLAEDGKKMSKRLKNYPDPMLVINKFGADSLRLFLIRSPAVRGETLNFKESGVLEVAKSVMNPWYSSLRFLAMAAAVYEDRVGSPFVPDARLVRESKNDLDRWIIAASHGLIDYVHREMAAYHLYTVVPRLCSFWELLTNWYIKLNRSRMQAKDDVSVEDQRTSLSVLFESLSIVTRLMAPFAPFFSEWVYQRLRALHPRRNAPDGRRDEFGFAESIHLVDLPTADPDLLDEDMESRVEVMRAVIVASRVARDKVGLTARFPSRALLIVHRNKTILDRARSLEHYLLQQTNSETIEYSSNEHEWCSLALEPDRRRLGPRLGKSGKKVFAALEQLSADDAASFVETGRMTIEGVELTTEDVHIRREFIGDEKQWSAVPIPVPGMGEVLVAVDYHLDQALLRRGFARTVASRIQRLRKSAGLMPTDRLVPCVQARLRNDREKALHDLKTTASTKPDLTPLPASGSGGSGPSAAQAAAAADSKDGSKPSKDGKSSKDGSKPPKDGSKPSKDKSSKKPKKDAAKKPAAAAEPVQSSMAAGLGAMSDFEAVQAVNDAIGENFALIETTTGDRPAPLAPCVEHDRSVAIAEDVTEFEGDIVVHIKLLRPSLLFPTDDKLAHLARSSLAAAKSDLNPDVFAASIRRTLVLFDPAKLDTPTINVVVDGVPVTAVKDEHFFADHVSQLRACPELGREYAAAGMDALAKAYLSL